MHSKPMENSAMCMVFKETFQASIFSSVVILKIKYVEWFSGLLILVGGVDLAKAGDMYLLLTTTEICKKEIQNSVLEKNHVYISPG